MYTITRMCDGRIYCEYAVKDEKKSFWASTEEEAVQSLIQRSREAASPISRHQIRYRYEKPPRMPEPISEADRKLLDGIRSGAISPVPSNDVRLTVTEDEMQFIQEIRKGLA